MKYLINVTFHPNYIAARHVPRSCRVSFLFHFVFLLHHCLYWHNQSMVPKKTVSYLVVPIHSQVLSIQIRLGRHLSIFKLTQ